MSRINSLKIKAKLLQKLKRKSGKEIRLKEAYQIIAQSAGYTSWRSMKESVDRHAAFRPPNTALPYWNNWYSTYEEAKSHMKQGSDFLIPYEDQYFLCGLDYIIALGIPEDDEDLGLVGNDWFAPKDFEALDRLVKKVGANDDVRGGSSPCSE